jgi:hypothetical protein
VSAVQVRRAYPSTDIAEGYRWRPAMDRATTVAVAAVYAFRRENR